MVCFRADRLHCIPAWRQTGSRRGEASVDGGRPAQRRQRAQLGRWRALFTGRQQIDANAANTAVKAARALPSNNPQDLLAVTASLLTQRMILLHCTAGSTHEAAWALRGGGSERVVQQALTRCAALQCSRPALQSRQRPIGAVCSAMRNLQGVL